VVPPSLAEKAAEIQEREEQLTGYRSILQASIGRIEDDMWMVADSLFDGASSSGMRRDWLRSIKLFNGRLPLHEVVDAAEIARAKGVRGDKKLFLYFCGICWNKIRAAEDGAHSNN
jgi:hypothetical protein